MFEAFTEPWPKFSDRIGREGYCERVAREDAAARRAEAYANGNFLFWQRKVAEQEARAELAEKRLALLTKAIEELWKEAQSQTEGTHACADQKEK